MPWHLFVFFFIFILSKKEHVKYSISAKVLLLWRGFSLTIQFQNMSNIFFFIFWYFVGWCVHIKKRSLWKLFFPTLLLIKFIFFALWHVLVAIVTYAAQNCWHFFGIAVVVVVGINRTFFKFFIIKRWRRWNKEKIMAQVSWVEWY